MSNLPNVSQYIQKGAVRRFEVIEWNVCPVEKNGEREIELRLTLHNTVPPVFLRIRDRRAAETLISALERHVEGVWPK